MKCAAVILSALVLLGLGNFVQAAAPSGGKLPAKPAASQTETSVARINEQIESYRDRITHKPEDAEARLKLAQLLEQKKDWAGVVEALRPVSDRLKRDGLLLLARAFREKGDGLNQIRTLELCMAKNPKDYIAQTSLGDGYLRSGRTEDAIAAFRDARQTNTQYLPAYQGMLRALHRAEDAYEARVLLHDMIKTFGPKPEFYNELCRLYSDESYLEKALEICQQAIEKSPRTPENYINLGKTLKDHEDNEKATKLYTDAAAKFPNSAPILTATGDDQLERKDFMAAYKSFRQAVIADRTSAKAAIGYAQAAFELQKNQESLDAFIKACQLDRALVKEFRVVIGKLRTRKDTSWQIKFEDGISRCP